MRLTNEKLSPQNLVVKAINQLLRQDLEYMDYIRSYANLLGDYRIKFIKNICNEDDECIEDNRLYSLNLYEEEINLIWDKIIKKLKK